MNKSKNYDKVERFYKTGLWTMGMARNAVGRWITVEEFAEITGQTY